MLVGSPRSGDCGLSVGFDRVTNAWSQQIAYIAVSVCCLREDSTQGGNELSRQY